MNKTPHIIEGTIEFLRSATDCKCCDGNHIFTRGVKFDDWNSKAPRHFTRDANQFLWDKILCQSDDLHGRRIRVTIEII